MERTFGKDPWAIECIGCDQLEEEADASLFNVGNGNLGVRGFADYDHRHSGVFLNGVFETEPILYPENSFGNAKNHQVIASLANPIALTLHINGKLLDAESPNLTDQKCRLDLASGLLHRETTWITAEGESLSLSCERFVSLERNDLLCIRWQVSGEAVRSLKLISAIEAVVGGKADVFDPRAASTLSERAMETLDCGSRAGTSYLLQRTRNSKQSVAIGVSHRVRGGVIQTCAKPTEVSIEFDQTQRGCMISVEKFVCFATDAFGADNTDLVDTVTKRCKQAAEAGFDTLKQEHRAALQAFWDMADVEISGDPVVQQGIRYNLFELFCSAGRNGRTAIAAKGLSGAGYDGHYFWDAETYIFPFFLFTVPQVARGFLEYRYRILDVARQRAREIGLDKGALFAWRTINGEECSAYFLAGTAQYHINADIAHAVKQYVSMTNDTDFLARCGAEILFETARFWIEVGYYNTNRGNRFCINCVTGPDEYTVLVNNNYYTNLMAQENLFEAARVYAWLKTHHRERWSILVARLRLDDHEPEEWRRAARAMLLPFDEASNLCMQDDGMFDRIPLCLDDIPSDKRPLLLHYHSLFIYRHNVCKQADTILAMILQNEHFSNEQKRSAFEYYEPITTHDSSLSPAIFGILASELGLSEKADEFFRVSARYDLQTDAESIRDGLHMANMGGSWLSIVVGYAGMRIYGGHLSFRPKKPKGWEKYRFHIRFQGSFLEVTVGMDHTVYLLTHGSAVEFRHYNQNVRLTATAPRQVQPNSNHAEEQLCRMRGIIFDLDGVLVSTHHDHYLAWKRIADELGVYFDQRINERLRGVSRMESLDILLEQYHGAPLTAAQKETLAERKNKYYREALGQLTPADVTSETLIALNTLRARGYRLAVGSSSKNARYILERIGLMHLFDAVCDGTVITNSKPDPEVFLNAASELGLPCGECCVIEDARSGIEAARRAGMRAIAYGEHANELDADDVLPAFMAILDLFPRV